MLKRTMTALALIGTFAFAFYLGKKALSFLIVGLILIAGYEIYHIKKECWPKYLLVVILSLLLSAYFIPQNMILAYISFAMFILLFISIVNDKFPLNDVVFVFFMIMTLSLAVFAVRKVMQLPLTVFIYILIATYSTDTFAYLGGSLFGKHKLIERISPNKTVEGALSGTIASVILSLIFAHFFLELNAVIIYTSSLLIPIIAQIGDLSFSLVKRFYKMKDFGNLFPGHGGALDRIDSIIFSLLAFNMILTLLG